MKKNEIFNAAVVVAALGYFVDVYDLVLFLVIGKKSLADIGVPSELILEKFKFLLDVQMVGMLVGGIVWGVLGDKKGRLSVLFGSIITYSLANIANGFVTDLNMYTFLRFVAGFGLAGELGAGITLVSEIMSKEKRGYGTMVVASVGVIGAVVAGFVGKAGWQLAYWIGGGLGLSLLLLRIGVIESGIFNKIKENKVNRGNFFQLFSNKEIAYKYLNCILIGLPVWFVIGKLVALAPVFAKELKIAGTIDDGTCVMLCYSGLVFGDLFSGMLSQYLMSRKKVFMVFYAISLACVGVYLNLYGANASFMYLMIFALGFSVGFWAIFVTVASEQFGTNLRATVTTTVPNFVRGSLVIIGIVFEFFTKQTGLGLIMGTVVVGVIVFSISFLSLFNLKETFGRDLDFHEIS
ncbi:MAG: MFS transporter [Bacteroidota bacterium]|nr:MFS transporter [Bacteroidota bacterium]